MRILDRIAEVYAIDATERGANRIGYGEGEQRAHDLVAGWLEEAGLAVDIDPDGNLLGASPETGRARSGSGRPRLRARRGRFDGALGVVAGLEAVERVGRAADARGRRLPRRGARVRGGATPACTGRLPEVYLEPHVEQGRGSREQAAPLGVVTGIAGIARGGGPRRAGRPCWHDADGRPGRRAREGGRVVLRVP